MTFEQHIHAGELHHAYIVEGDEMQFLALTDFLAGALGIKLAGNPDVYMRTYEILGVDDTRELVNRAHMRAFGGRKVFLCRLGGITSEAQNGLLKLLEEPPANTHFFFCVPSSVYLLPTLRSRVVVVPRAAAAATSSAREFLAAPLPKRLKILAPIVEEKNKEAAGAFLNELEAALYDVRGAGNAGALHHIIAVRGYIQDKGASLKVLLESVALIVPLAR